MSGVYALNFFSPAFVDQLKRGRKTATIRLGDKSRKYERGMVVWITVGQQHSTREKIFSAVIDDVDVKRMRELSPRDIEHDNPEFRRLEELQSFLRQIYGRDIDAEEIVTVIRFSQIIETPAGHMGNGGTPHPQLDLDGGVPIATGYRFLTTWLLETERERVWDAIYDSDAWPKWWRGVESAERLADGDESGIGQRGRYVWKARLPYRVSFEMVSTVVEPPRLLEGRASGELEGHGRWRLFEQPAPDGTPVTAVIYEWQVRTTKRWMNAIGPIAGPAFRSNHDWVMRNGGEGLAKLLGCRLLASD